MSEQSAKDHIIKRLIDGRICPKPLQSVHEEKEWKSNGEKN